MSEPEEKVLASFEVYEGPNGWSFRINGRESHFRSSQFRSIARKIAVLLCGPSGGAAGAVVLPTVGSRAGVMGDAPANPAPNLPGDEWQNLPTAKERINAFLRRGKLGEPRESTEAD